jgi:hypothetical protein
VWLAGRSSRCEEKATDLVTARARPEVSVREVEVLDAEGAGLCLVIFDDLIVLCTRHGCEVVVVMEGKAGGGDGGRGYEAPKDMKCVWYRIRNAEGV